MLIAWGRWNLALVLYTSGSVEEAEYHAREALAKFIADGYQEGVASTADIIAVIEAGRGNTTRAVEIFGASDSIFTGLQSSRWFEAQMLADPVLEAAREELGSETVDELLDQGSRRTLDQLIALISDQT